VGAEYRAEIAGRLYVSGAIRRDDNDDFEDAVTHSVAASWVIADTGSRLHASFGAGVANPTFFEQFGFDPGVFIGNPDLVPEEAEGWEIGLEQTLGGGLAVVDVTYFESTLENEIFTDFSVFPFTADNLTTESARSGWEAALQLFPTDDLDIVGSYTSLDASEPAGIEVRRPERQAALDARWRPGGGSLQLNLAVTYNGEQADTDFSTFLRTDMDAYMLVRAGVSHQLTDSAEIYGRVDNALDEKYEEIIGHLGSPRAAFVGVRIRSGFGR
jgi:vitamin B12 transporter